MSIEKTFNPDYDYSFWFWKTKFKWILEMLGLAMDYNYSEGEIDGMEISLRNTNNEDGSKWSGGLHYGNKGTMYINMALDNEDRDKVFIQITSSKKLQAQIEFIDLLQCTYQSFY